MTNKPVSREARLLIQLGEMGNALWKARDRCWKLGRERNHWKRESLEQARLLAISADREEKLRADLMLARKLADSAMLESDRLRAKLKQARDCFSAAMELAER